MNKPGFPHKYLSKVVSEKTRLSNIRAGVCSHWGCARPARSDSHKDCHTCAKRKTRMKHPLKYTYSNIKDSARKRKVTFNLTLDEFKAFCDRTGYLTKKGREFEDLTIDRIDSSKPYQADNIRALTWIDNCSQKLENMTNPAEPIARALAKIAKSDNWKAYLTPANITLQQVRALIEQEEKEFEENPF